MYSSDFSEEMNEKIAAMDKLLSKLQDCDLSQWDSDFVDDLAKRIEKFGNRTTFTARQLDQIDRMEKEYL